tara:strand:- start:795 stop:1346 length:552 start_codon:yes stop_codon:yes gene_type:complete
MRIISGEFKGKKILQPKDKLTRPLKDMVKESIFNILEHSNLFLFKIKKAKILDLFSGSGSFGLECISRGADHVTFFENYSAALSVLNKNINKLNCSSKIMICEKDIFSIELKNLKKFDLIFIDPPFKNEKISELIFKIKNSNILNKNGLIVLHRQVNNKDKFSDNFHIYKEKIYGKSKIFIGN